MKLCSKVREEAEELLVRMDNALSQILSEGTENDPYCTTEGLKQAVEQMMTALEKYSEYQ